MAVPDEKKKKNLVLARENIGREQSRDVHNQLSTGSSSERIGAHFGMSQVLWHLCLTTHFDNISKRLKCSLQGLKWRMHFQYELGTSVI